MSPADRVREMCLRRMEERGLSKAELARRMNVSRACVQLFFGRDGDLQLGTAQRVACALGYELVVDVVARKDYSK